MEERKVGDGGLLSGGEDVVGVGNVLVHRGVEKEGRMKSSCGGRGRR